MITTIAGVGAIGSYSSSVTLATLASINTPVGIAIDTSGSILYFADNGNHVVRKIMLSTVALSTIVGTGLQASGTFTASPTNQGSSVAIKQPYGIVLDSTNNILYFSENGYNVIRKVSYHMMIIFIT